MNKHQVTDKSFLNQVKQWIESDGDIYADIYFLHAGSAAHSRLIVSYKELEEITSSVQDTTGKITIVRHADFILRGIANAELLERALEILPENQEWSLSCPNPDDVFHSRGAQGNTHQRLKEAFERFSDKYIAINNKHDYFPPNRPPRGNEEVFILEFG